jgi:MoxR-like ATPase
MSNRDLLPLLSLSQTVEAACACVRASKVPMILGAPGVGKTSIVPTIAKAVGLDYEVMILSNYEAVDIGGLPVPDNGKVKRHLFGPLLRACEEPILLALDEFTTTPASVQGPALRLVLERVAGDRKLHPGTRIIALANPPEYAPGGVELTAAMINRVVYLSTEPTDREIEIYFAGGEWAMDDGGNPVQIATPTTDMEHAAARVLSHEAWQIAAAQERSDWANVYKFVSTLIQKRPPQSSVDAGDPWASPRAWQTALDCYAALGRSFTAGVSSKLDAGAKTMPQTDDLVGLAVMSGAVGPHAAAEYLAIRHARLVLPSADQVIADPNKAHVPEERAQQISALGLVSRVAERESAPAWIYVGRLAPEIAAVASKVLLGKRWVGKAHEEEGKKIYRAMLARAYKSTLTK